MVQIFFIFLAVLTISSSKKFDNFTLYRLIPNSLDALEVLHNLEDDEYDFWTHPAGVGKKVDLLVSPDKKDDIRDIINSHKIDYQILTENIQEKIDTEARSNVFRYDTSIPILDWNKYYRTHQIYQWLRYLEKKYPKVVKVVKGGNSFEGLEILGVKLSYSPMNKKRAVWIDSLIHAREWITGATNLYILNQLLTSSDEKVRQVAESHDWYIFPVLNPDGYEYSHTKDRLWRKSRKPYGTYNGADLNRNWDFRWNTDGASNKPSSPTYAGPKAFSETESSTLSQYLNMIGKDLIAYISFHSFSQLMLLPYGHTKQNLDNFNILYPIISQGKNSVAKRYGTKYTAGNTAQTIYVVSGTSADWVKAILKTPVVFTLELRDRGKNGFILPPNQIVPSGLETLDGLVTILQEADRVLFNKTI